MIVALSRFKVVNGLEDSAASDHRLPRLGDRVGASHPPAERRRLLERALSLNAMLAQKKGIQIALEIEGELPTLGVGSVFRFTLPAGHE